VDLIKYIEEAFEKSQKEKPDDSALTLFNVFMEELNKGHIRAAEKREEEWVVHSWVKKGILLGFRIGTLQNMSINDRFVYYDKHTYPLKSIMINDGIRIVPGGSAIRDGAYIGKDVICMPPMYINVGAYVDDGTLIDSHALVGSCAQIGKRVHVSAGTQIGGVLEPVGSLPVIIEDDVLIGGNCGIYEGTIISSKSVIGAGTVLTGSTPVYDLVYDAVYIKTEKRPLIIPPKAVVVPGSRPISQGRGKDLGLSVYSPIIIKYRDDKTEKSTQLEDLLR
jgi:2,3,4,5-tetrahydropyridine-2-carboxylate N-succinyltransferase